MSSDEQPVGAGSVEAGTVGGTAGERAYEVDARRWLRAYPPRWHRARADEVLGVLLDTRPGGATRLALRDRLDLLRGALAYRCLSHPPLVPWLLWRWYGVPPGPEHEEWARDDVAGRFLAFRETWLSQGGLFALVLVALLLELGGAAGWWVVPLLVLLVVQSTVTTPRHRRALRRRLDARSEAERLASGFDGSTPWALRWRYAWDARVLLPVAGLAVGAVLAGLVLMLWWTDPAARALAGREDPWLLVSDPFAWLPLGVLTGVALLHPVAVATLGPRRARTRPPQPWRAPPRPLPLMLVVPLTVGALLLPLGAVALPAVALAVPAGADTAPGSPSADALASAAGVALLLVPLLVLAGALAAAVLVCWLRVRDVAASEPRPPLALLDVLDLRGGEQVAVDPPFLLHHDAPGATRTAGPTSATGAPH